jgi:hypothetical protein
MLKTFRRCPKQTQYKYLERLKPRRLGKPLRQGSWGHSLLETYYRGGDWEDTHKKLLVKWGELFDEERDSIGDMPGETKRLMESYLWHYRDEHWKVHEVEYVIECELPNGMLYRGKVDLIVEDQFGLWIVDHKWNKRLPNNQYRLLDAQSALYLWAALRSGIPVQGFIWNYVRRKAPTVPRLVYASSPNPRLSKSDTDVDYLSLKRAIKFYGLKPKDYSDMLKYHKSLRYAPGEVQRSTFFRRDVLEKSPEMLKQVAREALHTARRMDEYPWDKVDFVERVPDTACNFSCSYVNLCSAELFTSSEATMLRRQAFGEADPMDYYNDDPKDHEGD